MPYAFDPEKIARLNAITTEKTKQSIPALRAEMSRLGIKHESGDGLDDSLNKRFSKTGGMINRIRYRFKKSGIWVHKGVGRGTKASQVGTTTRKAKEWFNPIIERMADDLVEELADEWVDIIFDKLKIR